MTSYFFWKGGGAHAPRAPPPPPGSATDPVSQMEMMICDLRKNNNIEGDMLTYRTWEITSKHFSMWTDNDLNQHLHLLLFLFVK